MEWQWSHKKLIGMEWSWRSSFIFQWRWSGVRSNPNGVGMKLEVMVVEWSSKL